MNTSPSQQSSQDDLALPRDPQKNPYLLSAPPELEKMELGGLKIKVATTVEEVMLAQQLRYAVFYEECGADPIKNMGALKRDYDDFDDVCTHLLVVDTKDPAGEKVIGTYRMLRQDMNPKPETPLIPFYSESEFDISNLKANSKSLMEVGRSCILDGYRDRFALQLLWQGIGAFIFHYDVDFLFGCASFEGFTDPKDLALPLSYLHHFHMAREEIRPVALKDTGCDTLKAAPIDIIAKEDINPKEALKTLPPLVKGYLRLNGIIGGGCIIDYQWQSVDVCIMVEKATLSQKHVDYYRRDRNASRTQ